MTKDFVELVEEMAAKLASGTKLVHSPGRIAAKYSCLKHYVEAADAAAEVDVHPIQCPRCEKWIWCPRCLS